MPGLAFSPSVPPLPTPVCPHSDGWLLVLASSNREICHLVPGRGDSKSISMETAVTCRLLSRPLGAGFFFASHLSGFSPPLFTRVSVNHHLNKPIWLLLHIQIQTALNLCVIVLLKTKKKFSHKSSSLLDVHIWPLCYFQSLDPNSTHVPVGLSSMIALFDPEGNTGPNGSF